ncbi:MAG: hypothetical protein ABIN89_00045 [Chitinophagaceae bacterium]
MKLNTFNILNFGTKIIGKSLFIPFTKQPGWISHSQYTAYLGSHKEFTKMMDTLIDKYGNLGNRLVFVLDGATWIKNWIEDAFPKAVSILDYYHACEHLHAFSGSIFTHKAKEKMWIDKQKEWLLKGEMACHQKTQMLSHVLL